MKNKKTELYIPEDDKDNIIKTLIEKLNFVLNELFISIGEEYPEIEKYLLYLKTRYSINKKELKMKDIELDNSLSYDQILNLDNISWFKKLQLIIQKNHMDKKSHVKNFLICDEYMNGEQIAKDLCYILIGDLKNNSDKKEIT